MDYKIIDNFLPSDSFNHIQEHLLGPNIEWAYNSSMAMPDNECYHDPYDFQFTHTFYRNSQPSSHHISLLDPILQVLNPSALVRIKGNLQPRSAHIVTHQHHLDHDFFDGKIAIFYVNSNNGYTLLSNGTKINSVENRLLIFDGNILHTGTTCTDQKVRVVINFMFYQWTNNNI